MIRATYYCCQCDRYFTLSYKGPDEPNLEDGIDYWAGHECTANDMKLELGCLVNLSDDYHSLPI